MTSRKTRLKFYQKGYIHRAKKIQGIEISRNHFKQRFTHLSNARNEKKSPKLCHKEI